MALPAWDWLAFSQLPYKKALKSDQEEKALLFALVGACLATITRYILHYIAGVIFWSSYAPKGMSAEWYSFHGQWHSWHIDTCLCYH